MKTWTRPSENNYELHRGEEFLMRVSFNVASAKSEATVYTKNEMLKIRTDGFWRTRIVIVDEAGKEVLTCAPRKWYASDWVVTFQNKPYQLKCTNRPLATYVLSDATNEILSYSLEPHQGRVRVVARGEWEEAGALGDAFLWYMLKPFAMENGSDLIPFLLMATA